MSRFQRGITNGIAIVATVGAITLGAFTDVKPPVGVWVVWICLLTLWVLYDSYITALENKRIRDKIDRAIETLLKVKSPMGMEPIGDTPLYTHPQSQCEGEACCVHNPSDHHMHRWVQMWREDIAIMERICPHGVGHPDPDDVDWRARTGRNDISTHGCDGCCLKVAA